jgi:glyoxylase-like metal-dependent hydrolase (beta-lactamase superfamily II)
MPRRAFLVGFGRGTLALTVVALSGCLPAAGGSTSPASSTSPPGSGDTGRGPAVTPDGSGAVAWERVDLGIVSAYVLVRGGEAAIVDTGVPGSEGDLAAVLERLGLGWDAVGHVVLTHRHDDHVGSAAAVLTSAAAAQGYAGAADLAAIAAPRPLQAVGDGDRVFDLQVVATPGHTAGHISVLDDIGGVLIAGDALNTSDGTVTGANPQFSDDMAQAEASVVKLATLQFDTLLVGHGDPITGGASNLVAALSAGY